VTEDDRERSTLPAGSVTLPAGSVDSMKDHKNYPIFKEWLGNSTQEEYELFQKWKERFGP
jgi:hypothetical protein